MIIPRPADSEYPEFYGKYVNQVAAANGPLAVLEAQVAAFERAAMLPEATGEHRYADGKWTVKEVLGHMADTERVFAYRLVRIARADETPLAGFDENAWAAVAPHRGRTNRAIGAELVAVRSATLALVRSLDEAAVARVGTANGRSISARALCWIMPGHVQHHLGVLAERYGVAL